MLLDSFHWYGYWLSSSHLTNISPEPKHACSLASAIQMTRLFFKAKSCWRKSTIIKGSYFWIDTQEAASLHKGRWMSGSLQVWHELPSCWAFTAADTFAPFLPPAVCTASPACSRNTRSPSSFAKMASGRSAVPLWTIYYKDLVSAPVALLGLLVEEFALYKTLQNQTTRKEKQTQNAAKQTTDKGQNSASHLHVQGRPYKLDASGPTTLKSSQKEVWSCNWTPEQQSTVPWSHFAHKGTAVCMTTKCRCPNL